MVNISSIRVNPRWALEFEYMAGAAIALVAAS
jgi:plasmid maintenance system killer protein